MAARKKKGSAGYMYRWQDAVEQTAHDDDRDDRPPLWAILVVASLRTRYADPNGGSCRPAASTLADRAGISRNTVAKVDGWLVEHGLMRHVRNHVKNVKEYRLVTPNDSDSRAPGEQQDDTDSRAPGEQQGESQSRSSRAQDAHGESTTSDLPHSGREEEATGAANAAPPPNVDKLLTRHDVQRVLAGVADAGIVDLDAKRVAAPIADLIDRHGWPAAVVAHIAVAKAKRATSNPTAYLARGLSAIAADPTTVTLPAWADAAAALTKFDLLESKVRAISSSWNERPPDFVREPWAAVLDAADLEPGDLEGLDEFIDALRELGRAQLERIGASTARALDAARAFLDKNDAF